MHAIANDRDPLSQPTPSTDSSSHDRVSLALGFALFFVSGASGLVDQLCFSKYLSYIVGSTAYAVSAVLAAFMSGLALGAYAGGKLARRVRRPLRAYGALELVVGLSVALTPVAFRVLTPLYVELARALPTSLSVLSVLRWLTALALVVVPTTAMGVTLPLLARLCGGHGESPRAVQQRERRLSTLYAVNTLGGALGALAAAYVILPAFGVDGTVFVSAAASAAIGVVGVGFGSPANAMASARPATAHVPHGLSTLAARPLALLAFASGFLVFSAEVVFSHLLALMIGNSAYAFGLILAAFLGCLFLGAAQAARVRRVLGAASLPFGLTLAGLALAASLPFWDRLPIVFNNTGEVLKSFAAREAVRALAAFAMLFLPTTLMGLTFPFILQRAASFADVGHAVGRLTAINTVGAVVGSLTAGYLLLPGLGSQRSLLAIACAFALCGVLGFRSARGRARLALLVATAATAALALLSAPWDLGRLTGGNNVYFDGYHAPGRLLMLREDVHGGVTSVTETDGVRTLYTNGKFQGNTGWEMNAQRFFAHYPSLFVKDFRNLLVIGLGTGTTLGTFAGYPWQHIDVAEISPSIRVAAEAYFRAANLGALSDPRVIVRHADGRNFLAVQERRYDLISMELTSIWFAGAASLYSREFYELVHRRLEAGAVFQQWVQLHHVSTRDFATILNTLRREFRHVTLFYGGGQGILVASDAPLVAVPSRVETLEKAPRIAATIPYHRPLIGLLDDILVSDSELDRFIADQARKAGEPVEQLVSTDSNLYLEYATPRGNVLPWSAREQLVEDLKRFRDPSVKASSLRP